MLATILTAVGVTYCVLSMLCLVGLTLLCVNAGWEDARAGRLEGQAPRELTPAP